MRQMLNYLACLPVFLAVPLARADEAKNAFALAYANITITRPPIVWDSQPIAKTAKVSPCSPACECGCREGGECACGGGGWQWDARRQVYWRRAESTSYASTYAPTPAYVPMRLGARVFGNGGASCGPGG